MNIAKREKKKAILKRGEHIILTPKEIKTNPIIICNGCRKDSGYKNDDLIMVRGNKDIKCKECGKVCIQIRSNEEVFETQEKIIIKSTKKEWDASPPPPKLN